MAKRVTPPQPAGPAHGNVHHFADQLADITLACTTPSPVVIDRRLAPIEGAPAVVLPPCGGTDCKAGGLAGITKADPVETFTDLIKPACWWAMTDEERDSMHARPMPTARLAIDNVSDGLARTVEPSPEDVARVRSPERRADIMLALGWLAASCGCLQALMRSLPDDTPQGVYVRAGSMPSTPPQLAEIERSKQRQADRSKDWSAYLMAMAEARRRPAAGDLFDAFGLRISPMSQTPSAPA